MSSDLTTPNRYTPPEPVSYTHLDVYKRQAIAHILVSFGFEDGRYLVFTVETRKEKGERYSELGGFFKEFELSIVATDERDAVRVRTNVRDEDVYLYRIDMPRPCLLYTSRCV